MVEVNGIPIETIYLYLLILAGASTLLYLFFGDAAGAAEAALSWLNPALLLSFLTFGSASGLVLEHTTKLNSFLIIALSAILSIIVTALLHFFVLLPLSKAEESLVYTEQSLNGRVGKVILTVPREGFGEVVIDSFSGMIAKPAKSYDDCLIKEGSSVLVIDIENGVLLVKEYEPLL
ncbi:hypothetical protein V1498_09575 [Peribacillus sp. SCS-26]|uniref:hypothetical protein n=1 Tax=Paraperibacillus marinus TaxID=3115295 RepID=UPI003906692F